MINKKTIIAVFGLGRIGLMHVENLSNHKDLSPRTEELPSGEDSGE